MRAPQILLTIAVLLFSGFLVSPGFVDSVKGDNTIAMSPGWVTVVWHALLLPSAITQPGRDALVLISILLANLAFVILPLTVALGRFRPQALRYTFCLLFVFGMIAMAWLIRSSEHVAFGAHLWLLAALAAASYCLLPRSHDAKA
jgi:hypothetical protein